MDASVVRDQVITRIEAALDQDHEVFKKLTQDCLALLRATKTSPVRNRCSMDFGFSNDIIVDFMR